MKSHNIDGFPSLSCTNDISCMSNLTADDRDKMFLCPIISMLQFESKDIVMIIGKVEVN